MAENEEGGSHESAGAAGGDAHAKHGGGHKRHKEHPHEEHVNLERWLVSYADFMTLLFCLFTVLYAMSIVDKSKVQEVAKSVTKALGMGGPYEARVESSKDLDRGDIYEGTEGILDKSGRDVVPDFTYKRVARRERVEEPTDNDYSDKQSKANSDQQEKKMEQLAGMLEEAISSSLPPDLHGKVTVEMVRGLGVRIVLPSEITFQSGEADFKKEFVPALMQIGKVLDRIDNNIVIEGHTDNIPIRSDRYPSNWELSTNRATSVLHFLVENYKLNPKRFSASGLGEYHPVVPNTSPSNREKNRRAVIIIREREVQRPKKG